MKTTNPNRHERRAMLARNRYLTESGLIRHGRELFKLPKGTKLHSVSLCHPDCSGREATAVSLNQLRRMQPRERRAFFNASAAWSPST